jgi:hypothetical protein
VEAIKYYVKGAFTGVKETPEVLEQQEELIADLTSKVADLVGQGRSEEETLGMAIASVGDLSALVSEFDPAEGLSTLIPTAAVYATRLDLHVVTVSAGIGAVVMIGGTALGAITKLVQPGAGFALFAVLALAVWWIRKAYLGYQAAPDAVEVREVRELIYKMRFRNALAVWFGVSFVAVVLNLLSQVVLNLSSHADFWCWPFWVAAGVWPLTVKVEKWFAGRTEFVAPDRGASETA